MSRDFTPVERYFSNKQSGENVWLHNFKFVNTQTGEETMMYSEEEQALRKRYKNLAVAMCGSFLTLHSQLPESIRYSALDRLEEMQKELQEAVEKKEFYQCDLPEPMKKWFVGELDENFYYHETNDKLYLDWCIKYLTEGKEQ